MRLTLSRDEVSPCMTTAVTNHKAAALCANHLLLSICAINMRDHKSFNEFMNNISLSFPENIYLIFSLPNYINDKDLMYCKCHQMFFTTFNRHQLTNNCQWMPSKLFNTNYAKNKLVVLMQGTL